MDKKLKKRFDETQKLFLEAVKLYVPDSNIKVETEDLAEMRKNDIVLSKRRDYFPPSFGISITLSSTKHRKNIKFGFSDGTTTYGMYYHSLTFSIRHEKKWFNLQDYFKHNGIDKTVDDFFDASDYDEATKKIKKFIEQVVFLLEQEDIKHILSSKDWIQVPHDKSMYF